MAHSPAAFFALWHSRHFASFGRKSPASVFASQTGSWQVMQSTFACLWRACGKRISSPPALVPRTVAAVAQAATAAASTSRYFIGTLPAGARGRRTARRRARAAAVAGSAFHFQEVPVAFEGERLQEAVDDLAARLVPALLGEDGEDRGPVEEQVRRGALDVGDELELRARLPEPLQPRLREPRFLEAPLPQGVDGDRPD